MSRHNFSASLLAFLTVVASQLFHANQAAQVQVQVLPGQQQQVTPAGNSGYFGSLIGKLEGRSNNVSGLVFAVDEQTIFIKAFNYDGLAPDTYFWSSVIAQEPSGENSFIVPDEKGSTKPLERYLNKDLVLRLPEGKTLREIHWLSVWSRGRRESLADLQLQLSAQARSSSAQFSIPRPLEISPFTQLAHGLRSGPITIVDAQTFLVPDFHYDGLGPTAFFWLARGKQGLQAAGLKLKDENGNSGPLRKYSGETVVISLPDELTIYQFDYFGVWCKEYGVSFGHTKIPQTARVPPSPKMLGIKPENKLNCEILYDELGFEIRWVLDGDDIVMQLVGKIESGEYMAFGLGKDDARSEMDGADAAVAWVDRSSGQVHAVDYYLGSKQQCSAPDPTSAPEQSRTGSCPDAKLPGGGDSLTLLHGAIVNGYSMVTFKRPQLGVDERYDQHVYSDGQQSILWAIGPLNSRNEIGYHRLRARNNLFIDFARHPQWNCPVPDLNATMHSQQLAQPTPSPSSSTGGFGSPASESSPATTGAGHTLEASASASSAATHLNPISSSSSSSPARQLVNQPTAESAISVSRQQAPSAIDTPLTTTEHSATPWFIPSIVCPQERTLYAQIGPTGGRRGFEGVTGRPSWGVAWYVNGLMVPELVLERGTTYRFIVEGGNDKTSNTRRHPFYLTDSVEGAFDFKRDDQRQKERVFAGVAVRVDGQFVPTAEGRLCEWKQTNQTLSDPDLYPSYAAYQRSLKLECLPGQAGMLKFTPEANTPDLIYYQCYTHPYMGWRIRIVDSCASYLSAQKVNGGTNQAGIISGSPQRTGSLVSPLNNISKRDLSAFLMLPSSLKQNYERRSFTSSTPSSTLATGISGEKVEARAIERQEINNLLQELNALDDIPGFSNEMFILNSSLLAQRQPLNLSSFDEVLKLSPADLEFIDKQQQPFESIFDSTLVQTSPFATLFPVTLNNNNLSESATQQVANKQTKPTQHPVSSNRTFARQAKNFQNYIRRLASIYYPVQQQLTNILTSQQQQQQQQQPLSSSQTTKVSSTFTSNNNNKPSVTTNQSQSQKQQQQQLLSSASEQTSSFSLSSLVPKSKIDLSKSGITKKLNKFRFKSNKQQQQQQPEQQVTTNGGSSTGKQVVANQPPTPAIEFNYDIFNNQLAELEKHSKQLQDLELMSWPQQQQIDSLNYMPMLTAASADQPAGEFAGANFMSSSPFMGASMSPPAQPAPQHYPAPSGHHANLFQHVNSQLQVNQQQQQVAASQQQHQLPRPANQQPQHNHMLDYLALMFHENKTAGNQQQEQQDLGRFISQQQQFQSQPAIFVARMPIPAPVASHLLQFPPRPSSWPNQQATPHLFPQQQFHQQQQQLPRPKLPEQPQTQQTWQSNQIFDHQEDTFPVRQVNQQQRPALLDEPSESLSGSGSGAHYDFRQQSGRQQAHAGESLDQEDHIVAMERYSKQPTERQPPSIVHPITGEQLKHSVGQVELSASDRLINQQNQYQQNQRQLANLGEPLDAEQTQMLRADLNRINFTSSPEHLIGKTTPESATTLNQNQIQQQQPRPAGTTATTMPPSLSGSSAGPLIPSLGPSGTLITPSVYNQQQQQVALRSTTLLESSQPTNFISPNNYETSPFTPIEITGNSLQQQQHFHLPQQLPRLRPSPLVESMMSQHLNPFRPEPPVQVASFLAQHLINQHPQHEQPQTEQLMSSSSDKSQQVSSSTGLLTSSRINPMSVDKNETGSNQQLNRNHSKVISSEGAQQGDLSLNEPHNTNQLIILKPALPADSSAKSHTYLLKPEYLTHTHQVIQPASLHQQLFAPDHELYYAASNAFGHDDEGPSRRLAGYHQFDRISSLSSNDIALDPINMASSSQKSQMTSSSSPTNQNTSAISSSTSLQPSSFGPSPEAELSSSTFSIKYSDKFTPVNTTSSSQNNNNNHNQLAQQHHRHIPVALGYDEYQTPSAQLHNLPDSQSSFSSYQDNSAFNIDNNTDNAILSHVMSLIHSNAIPTPPLIPVSTYSNADYFMPISDRIQRSIRG